MDTGGRSEAYINPAPTPRTWKHAEGEGFRGLGASATTGSTVLGRDTTRSNEVETSNARTLFIGVLLLTGAFVAAAAPSGAWHSDMPVVHEETVEGAGAFGVETIVDEPGDVGIALTGWGPAQSATISAGVTVHDENKNDVFTFALTAHGSPDRTIVSPAPEAPAQSGTWDDGAWTTEAIGDASVLEDVDITIDVFEQPVGSDLQTQAQPVIRVATTSSDASGDVYRTAWVGDVAQTTLEVESDAGIASVDTVAGTAYVKGDADIEEGTPNVQLQTSELPATVGAKVMNDATVEVDAEHGLSGFWGLSDFKLACQYQVGACLWASQVYAECSAALGEDCSPGQISWDGPDSAGEGSGLYSLDGTSPGAHTFTVDHKVDIYGPSEYDEGSGTYASLGEHFSYLTVADVTLP